MTPALFSSTFHHCLDWPALEVSPIKVGYLQEDRQVGSGAWRVQYPPSPMTFHQGLSTSWPSRGVYTPRRNQTRSKSSSSHPGGWCLDAACRWGIQYKRLRSRDDSHQPRWHHHWASPAFQTQDLKIMDYEALLTGLRLVMSLGYSTSKLSMTPNWF